MITKIICIDDDPIALTICNLFLKKNLEIDDLLCFRGAKEALDHLDGILAQKEEYKSYLEHGQLLFLDLSMPKMSGFDFLDVYEKNYSQYFPNCKIIVLSSSIDPNETIKVKSYPSVLEFICKPINKKDIAALMSNEFVQSLS